MKGFISKDLHPFTAMLVLLLFIAGGFFIGNFVAVILMKLLFKVSLTDITLLTQNPNAQPNGKMAINLFQGVTHLFAFTLGPLAYLYASNRQPGSYLSPQKYVPGSLLVLSALLILFIMPANSWVINWNANVHFPEALKAFEAWAKAKEETLKVLTIQLTVFDNAGQFVFGMVVFGLIPAIGEEIVFRGLLQRSLLRVFNNTHVAVWVAAFIFGAIHMQFYGFIPRMLLGAILGYLYAWSGNIWVPIAGHFMNNGFTVLVLYLQQRKLLNFQIESTDSMPLGSILFSLIISVVTLLYLYRSYKNLPLKQSSELPSA
ncbi:CPBP family intramembrane glutamic endopeptidase [Adhaeribacter radiodurans]|uniref:CPBP family intramembrane metalloprotease n=1 Tax=Adhaeribacter radiodurans TaxID=2745197 RepID=A0A7L7L4J3_9BACT|nr:CPBP family intramembrane glutamic endopeptidase [Adhaeribacter radiodurans]QMU27732.1 CPBP family intramembrane metalloprotease [Adhaeribacter radiodurans]